MSLIRLSLIAASLLAIAACGDGDKDVDPLAERDPAVTGALSDPIMADPDLTGQSRNGAALGGGGPATAEIPPFNISPEEVAIARAQAAELLGGSVPVAPLAEATTATSPLAKARTAQAVAEALALGGKGCAAKISYSAVWAIRLPAALPVYPRGHVQEAAGTDESGCALRVVNFVTPVPVGDVIAFYHARASKAGLSPRHTQAGEDEVVQGGSSLRGWAVHVRRKGSTLTEVDLAVAGM